MLQKVKTAKTNGSKNAVSRYTRLKMKFDSNLFNSNWIEIDTQYAKNHPININYVDLFSGAGGLSLGFKQAGFNKIMSVEIDKDASNTMRKNFPNSYHYEGNIEHLENSTIKKIIGNQLIHIICGGPPCQGFSVAGLRNPNDKRNQLFNEFVRIVSVIKPWYVVLENVPGILTMEKGKFYMQILKQFESIGYKNMSVRILEAAMFGVPQLRTRAIFVGNRLNLANPYPKEQLKRENYKSIELAIDNLKKHSS